MQRERLAGLLHRTDEGWRSRRDAFVRAGRACVRAAAHEVSDNRMAAAVGEVTHAPRAWPAG
jgi:hypothetical protein